jgi:hypothetical protein
MILGADFEDFQACKCFRTHNFKYGRVMNAYIFLLLTVIFAQTHTYTIKNLCSTIGEGEYVPFANDCICEGPVEVWLQNVVDAMQVSV